MPEKDTTEEHTPPKPRTETEKAIVESGLSPAEAAKKSTDALRGSAASTQEGFGPKNPMTNPGGFAEDIKSEPSIDNPDIINDPVPAVPGLGEQYVSTMTTEDVQEAEAEADKQPKKEETSASKAAAPAKEK
jgi:hypothetical protein